MHGHFYQPPREDPFSGRTIGDASAAPAADWTARVTSECYAPNAAVGNFGRIGWDLGPTLARWLRREQPTVHDAIVAQDDGSNGMAQAYHHAILPYASARDRRTEIRWGLRDFELRVGRRATGMWLPETATDRLTLRICVEEGVRWTILAPWQVEGELARGVAGVADVGAGRRIVIGCYDAGLSTAVSFDQAATSDADAFLDQAVRPLLADGRSPLIATDGELYGHHQAFRDLFLRHLLGPGASARGVPVTTPGATLGPLDPEDPALPRVTLRERTSWSCHHGIARWGAECPCAGVGAWKGPLRSALDRLAGAIDARTALAAAELRLDPWTARDRYVDVASGFSDADAWAAAELARAGRPTDATDRARLTTLMTAQSSRLAMFASCGWFWDDPVRPEVLQVLRLAAHAVRLIDGLGGPRIEPWLVEDLGGVPVPGPDRDGRALYRAALTSIDQPGSVRPS